MRSRSIWNVVAVCLPVLCASPSAGVQTLTASLPGGASMEFVWIEPGQFVMGSPDSEAGRSESEGPQHEVTLAAGFWLAKYELTQRQWRSTMGTAPWEGQTYAQASPDDPATYVSWYDVQELIRVLNQAIGDSLYRFPTEAEWEYACRAGTETRWSFGDDESQVENYAWYDANNMSHTQLVGTKGANAWGLHDMHGNVLEWVQDWLGSYSSEIRTNPTGAPTGSFRVTRGGAFSQAAQHLRSASRSGHEPGITRFSIGARLARVNRPPTLGTITSQSVVVGSTLRLTLPGSDPDGDPLTYSVSGSPAGSILSGNAFTWTPGAGRAGSYSVTFTVSDGRGGSASQVVAITVTPASVALLTDTLPGGATMGFVWIAPGALTMGSPSTEPGRSSNEGPQHQVSITKGFYLASTEITQGQWTAVMGTTPWSDPSNSPEHVEARATNPAVYISWEDVQELVHRLNTAAGDSLYRLPTEAEWEYTCRAGTATRWSFGEDESQLSKYAWFDFAAPTSGLLNAQPVATKLPNAWGLYDMYGNVWEWVQDWYASYPSGAQVDPQGAASGALHILRGGSFGEWGQSATRLGFGSSRGPGIGARLVRLAAGAPANTPADGDTTAIGAGSGTLLVTTPAGTQRELVYVPEGEFVMGKVSEPPDPGHPVYLDAYYIDKYEVTIQEFETFAQATGIPLTSLYQSFAERPPDHPAQNVPWEQASAYCGWAGLRLPTEAEWEKAARGTDGRTYPWGDELDSRRANYFESGDPFGGTTPVGYYDGTDQDGYQTLDGRSPYGAHDMAGNVYEWCQDWYSDSYYSVSPYRNPLNTVPSAYKVMRGGAWGYWPSQAQAHSRNKSLPSAEVQGERHGTYVGFRCVRSGVPIQGLVTDPMMLAFGQVVVGQRVTRTVRVSNSGTASLALTVTAAAPFSCNRTALTIAPGASEELEVIFVPALPDEARDYLLLAPEDGGTGRAMVVLSGSGRLPPQPDIQLTASQLTFGEVCTGAESVLSLEVRNVGELPLQVDTVRVTGAGLSASPSSLAVPVGQSSIVTVSFAPKVAGIVSGQLVLVSNDPDEDRVTVPLSGTGRLSHVTVSTDTLSFGHVMVGQTGSQVLTIANNSASAINVTNVVPGDPQYRVSSRSFSLAAGGSRDVTVTFTPLAGQPSESSLTILTSDVEVPALTLVLSATSAVAGGPAAIAVLPNSLTFGSVALGQSKSVSLLVTNSGGSSLRVLNVVASSGDVTVSKSSFSLAAGAEELLTVTLQPTTAGSLSETLELQSNDPLHPTVQVPLRATVTTGPGRPTLALDTPSLSFGQVAIGETSEFLLPVRNAGTATLTISNAVSDNVQVVASPTSMSVPPQETRTLTVRYRPMPGMPLSGRLTLYSNDTSQPQVGVNWSAVEVRSPYLSLTRVTPADKAYGVATSTELQLVFSEPLYYRRGYTALDIAVQPEPLSGPVEADLQVRGDGRTVVIPVTLASGTVYHLVVYGATGRSGLELFDMVESSFSTGAAPPVLAKVSGRAAVASGEQLTGSVYLYDAQARLAGQASIALDGSFELAGVAEGTYRLYFNGATADGGVATGIYDATGDGVADALSVRAGVDQTGLTVTATVRSGTAPVVSGSPVAADLDSATGNQGLATLGGVGGGQSVVLEVYATVADGWTGAAVTVAFDSTQVAYAGAEAGAGNLLQKNDGTALFLSHLDPTAATVEFGGAILGPTATTAVSGAGLLGRFRFTTAEGFTGETALRVTLVKVQSLTGRANVEPALTATLRGSGSGTTGGADTGPLVLDFNPGDGDQRQRTGGSAVAGKTYTVQLHATGAPTINGWSAKIEYDPLQVRYVSGSFQPSSVVPGLLSLVEEKASYVSVGGAVLGSGGGSGSGDGLLGTASFEVLAGFTDSTDLVIRQMSWKVVGSGEQMLTVLARGTISAATAGLAGDFNDDGAVNFSDFFLFADAFGGSDPAYDLTADGAVNFSDFFVFADAFGTEARGKLMELAQQYLGLPAQAGLESTWPNPFNAATTIRYRLSAPGLVTLAVYGLTGQRVTILVDEWQEAGSHEVTWDGRAEDGVRAATGAYLIRLAGPGEVQVRKVTLLR